MPGIALELRTELAHRLDEARARTDAFFALLAPSTLYVRAISERHRVVFYLGHLEAFDWNLLGRQIFDRPSFDPDLDRLFAFGIDPVDGALPTDPPSAWPTLAQIRAYNTKVRAIVDDLIAHQDLLVEGADGRTRAFAVEIAIEHRLMHAETLAYMLPYLPVDGFVRRIVPAEQPGPSRPGYGRTGEPGRVRHVPIPAGIATLGQERAAGAFGWDNEFERHEVKVPAFTIDARNVTNCEYLEFVRAGGYRERSLWTEADWKWRAEHELQQPILWHRRGNTWWQRASFAEIPLDMHAPVQASLAEARAYARWRRARLMSETEFHRAAYGTRTAEERAYPWGSAAPDPRRHGNFDFLRYDPVPVGAYPGGDSAFSVADLVGNGWEWTDTPFAPFAGFRPYPHYEGYSKDFFDGKHYVIKGGSAQTAAPLLRRSFRNWFQPHYPYVFASFRCVDAS